MVSIQLENVWILVLQLANKRRAREKETHIFFIDVKHIQDPGIECGELFKSIISLIAS